MNQALNNLTAAILCGRLVEAEGFKPLTVREWHKLIMDLNGAGYKYPCCLLKLEQEQIAAVGGVTQQLAGRIFKLINYRYVVEKKLDELKKMGVSIVGMDNRAYPDSLIQSLNTSAPPILFCFGNIKLLNQPSIGITGSRKPDDQAADFARFIGKKIAEEGFAIVSGGALGCDTIAEYNATLNGGCGVLYMAAPLNEAVKNARIKALVDSGKMCLVWDHSPFEPFSAANALGRNKYIYGTAKASVVIASKSGKGGSFAGASYCIKNNVGKVFAYKNGGDGNAQLINMGANEIDYTDVSFNELTQTTSLVNMR